MTLYEDTKLRKTLEIKATLKTDKNKKSSERRKQFYLFSELSNWLLSIYWKYVF